MAAEPGGEAHDDQDDGDDVISAAGTAASEAAREGMTMSRVPVPGTTTVCSSSARTVFEQPDTDAVQAQMRHVLDAPEAESPKAAAHLDAAQHDLPAFTVFPREIGGRSGRTIRRSG